MRKFTVWWSWHGVRQVGWWSWVALNEWAGLPRPRLASKQDNALACECIEDGQSWLAPGREGRRIVPSRTAHQEGAGHGAVRQVGCESPYDCGYYSPEMSFLRQRNGGCQEPSPFWIRDNLRKLFHLIRCRYKSPPSCPTRR